MNNSANQSGLTDFQIEVSKLFFSLPESDGFVVVGGAALIANGVVDRRTDDLDFFTSKTDVRQAVNAFKDSSEKRNWRFWIDEDRNYPTFTRAHIAEPGMADDDAVTIEFAQDAPPLQTTTFTVLGPTINVEDSAGQKMLALFGRAAPRDFVDIHALSARYRKDELISLAAERDLGFDTGVFGQMLDFLEHITDEQLEVEDQQVQDIRLFFGEWRRQLSDEDTRTSPELPRSARKPRPGAVTAGGLTPSTHAVSGPTYGHPNFG